MSSITDALARLDRAIGRLENTADSACDEFASFASHSEEPGLDADFLVARIDRAIACVETLLSEGV